MFTRIVRTGLASTVSTPAIPAAWTMWVAPRAASVRPSRSSTSPCRNRKFSCSPRSVPESASRWRLSKATTSFSSTSRRARVVPMNPAPPVIRILLPVSGTGASLPAYSRSTCRASSSPWRSSSAAIAFPAAAAGGMIYADASASAPTRPPRCDSPRCGAPAGPPAPCRGRPRPAVACRLSGTTLPADTAGRRSAPRSSAARRPRA